MKWIVIAAAVSAGMIITSGANAQEALAKSSGCLNCHAADTKKVGPAFKDVAAKYKGKSDAESTLVEKLKSGKGHPAVKTNEADTKSLVDWILAM